MLHAHSWIFIRSVLGEAWSAPYNGLAHHVLLENINAMPHKQPYSNFAVISQSSGSGKSRMVHEQANLVFTIPFNLRDQADSACKITLLVYMHPN